MNWMRILWENASGHCPIELEIDEAKSYADDVLADTQAGERLYQLARETQDCCAQLAACIEGDNVREAAFAAYELGRTYESMRAVDSEHGGWMTSTEAANYLGLNIGRITHLTNNGKLRTNGKTYKEKRIHARDVIAYRHAQQRRLDELDNEGH